MTAVTKYLTKYQKKEAKEKNNIPRTVMYTADGSQ